MRNFHHVILNYFQWKLVKEINYLLEGLGEENKVESANHFQWKRILTITCGGNITTLTVIATCPPKRKRKTFAYELTQQNNNIELHHKTRKKKK